MMAKSERQRFWVGVASRNHVKSGEAGGFCQLCHGKATPVRRMRRGDGLIDDSPNEEMQDGAPMQAFTALGLIRDDAPYLFAQAPGFTPMRRDVLYLPSQDTPIRPLLPLLDFISNTAAWGMTFRRGAFEISAHGFEVIARHMRVERCTGWTSGLSKVRMTRSSTATATRSWRQRP
jgi:EVE domain